ncbi:MAG: RNA-splicing factor [Thelocarpon superellum]|nr:MAG: RNA-splicing factor [Thelocarpon superellum]
MDSIETVSSGAPPKEPVALFKKRFGKAKTSFRKRPATPPPTGSDSESREYSSEEDENGRQIKRRRRHATVITASSGATRATTNSVDELQASKHAADRTAAIISTNDATRQSNWYDEASADALSSKNLLGTTRARSGDAVGDGDGGPRDSTYKGAANYQTFIQKNPNAPSRQVGPVKAPTNIRTITVTDFAPDVCKDYKQTGFCGFGDSCKFLHAREDYKQGWELDRDWEVGSKGKKEVGSSGHVVASASRSSRGQAGTAADEEDDEAKEEALLESIPFACIICKKSYTNPIVTKCGHYFCEACALTRYRKSPSCAACGAGTGGVFNGAKGLRKLLGRKRARAERIRHEEGSGSEDEGEDAAEGKARGDHGAGDDHDEEDDHDE